jgi:hypothetical protein
MKKPQKPKPQKPQKNLVTAIEEDDDSQYPSTLSDPNSVPTHTPPKNFKLNSERATELLGHNIYKAQRDFKQHVLDFIVEKMKTNLFHGNEIAIARLGFKYTTEEGVVTDTLMINGRHTCEAAIKTGIVTDNSIVYWDCPTTTALAVAYNQYDNSPGNRTVEDQCKAYIECMNDPNWNKSSVNKLSTAASVVELGMGYRSRPESNSVDKRVSILKSPKYIKVCTTVRDLIYKTPGGVTANRKMAKAQCVMSTILETHMIALEAAKVFWEEVRKGEGPLLSPPREVWNLLNNADKKKITPLMRKVRCHQAWNAWCLGKTFSGKGKPNNEPPKLLIPTSDRLAQLGIKKEEAT